MKTNVAALKGAGTGGAGREPVDDAKSIVTRMTWAALPIQIWDRLMFYEQIERPPLHLRLLLPLPIRTEGSKSEVGDTARCLYEEGHLLKRVTGIDRGSRYEFEISQQNLPVGGGMRLLGGCYLLRQIGDGRTEVSLTTSYVSPRRPRWLWEPIEAAVCHSFHQHILRAIRRKTQSRSPRTAGLGAAAGSHGEPLPGTPEDIEALRRTRA